MTTKAPQQRPESWPVWYDGKSIANQKKYGIEHNNNQLNAAGRRVWGFKGIGPVLKLSMTTCDGWQRAYPTDNPFT